MNALTTPPVTPVPPSSVLVIGASRGIGLELVHQYRTEEIGRAHV